MKLWEAILIGCDKRPQAFKSLFIRDSDGTVRSCALGAAQEASGVFNIDEFFVATNISSRVQLFRKQFPILSLLCKLPDCCGAIQPSSETLDNHITHLNDDHRWPREKIALEFVKPIEDALND